MNRQRQVHGQPANEPTSASSGNGSHASATPVLEARGLVKTFGRVIGLADVDLVLNAGEVLGIIGDNGAGKSTLIKCLTGALQPDRGEILLEGKPVSFKSPTDAAARASRRSTRRSPWPPRSTSQATCSSAASSGCAVR